MKNLQELDPTSVQFDFNKTTLWFIHLLNVLGHLGEREGKNWTSSIFTPQNIS